MAEESEIERLLDSMSKAERQEVFLDAGIRREALTDSEHRVSLRAFKPEERRARVLPILVRKRISNDSFRSVAAESYVDLWSRSNADVFLRFPMRSQIRSSRPEAMPVPDLTTASLVVWELSVEVARVLNVLGVKDPLDPPQTTVVGGSINFSFGGGPLIVAGLGFMVAAHAALPPGIGADISWVGGSIIASLGLPELILGWRKMILEEKATKSETILNAAKTAQVQLETLKLQRELFPPASLIPPSILVGEARRYGIEPELGAQLVNEVLPTLNEMSRSLPAPITVSSGASGRSASSSS